MQAEDETKVVERESNLAAHDPPREPAERDAPGALDLLSVPRVVGRYELIHRLGHGGMATVYVGRAMGTAGFERLVAIKVIHPHLANEPEFVEMFLDEARIAAKIHHPNVVETIDLGEDGDLFFMVMEYVEGETLSSLLRQMHKEGRSLPLSVALQITLDVCKGLAAAHSLCDRDGTELRLVHRDVSPANVMVAFDGTVKLLDFGIARLSQETQKTRAGTLKGKVGYMSPEQCKGVALDRRSDVFGLGVLLYELAVRRRAFFGDNDFAVMNRIVQGEFLPPREVVPELPGEVEALILDALNVNPEQRPATAAAFAARLRSWADAAGLDRRPQMLESFLREKFGHVPSPALDVPELIDEVAALAVTPFATSPRRLWPIGVGAGLLAAGFVLGGSLMRGPAGAEASATDKAAGAIGGSIDPLAVEPDVSPQGESDPATPSPLEDAQELVIEDEAPQAAPVSRKTKRRKTKRRDKKRASPASPDKPRTEPRPGSSVLPPSWRERAN